MKTYKAKGRRLEAKEKRKEKGISLEDSLH